MISTGVQRFEHAVEGNVVGMQHELANVCRQPGPALMAEQRVVGQRLRRLAPDEWRPLSGGDADTPATVSTIGSWRNVVAARDRQLRIVEAATTRRSYADLGCFCVAIATCPVKMHSSFSFR